jgi:hypothetical protein
VDKPNDVNACDSYTLPILTTGKYYTIWRKGNQLNPGVNYKYTKIYGKKKGGRFICEDENPFTITISKTPFYRNLLILRFADPTLQFRRR